MPITLSGVAGSRHSASRGSANVTSGVSATRASRKPASASTRSDRRSPPWARVAVRPLRAPFGHPADRARHAHPEPRRSLASARAARTASIARTPRIPPTGMFAMHAGLPPTHLKSESVGPWGIPHNSCGSETALGSFQLARPRRPHGFRRQRRNVAGRPSSAPSRIARTCALPASCSGCAGAGAGKARAPDRRSPPRRSRRGRRPEAGGGAAALPPLERCGSRRRFSNQGRIGSCRRATAASIVPFAVITGLC